MGPTIAASVYGAVAIIAAWIFRPRVGAGPAISRGALFWLVSTPLLFLLGQPMLALLVCGFFAAMMAPRTPDDRGPYFLLVFFAVPAGISAFIPFPGINFLILLDWAKLTAIVLLAPALLGPPPLASRHARGVGVVVILMYALFALQAFRASNLTSGLRECVDLFLLYLLPYIALIRIFFRDSDHFDRVGAVLIFIGVIFFFTALISQVTSWNYYTFLVERMGFPVFADFRGGILRVSVTLNTVLAGYIMTLALLATEYFRGEKRIKLAPAWIYRVMFVGAVILTVSRGAWLAMAAALATFYFFSKAPRGLRPIAMSLLLLIGVPTALVFVMSQDLSTIDQYGSFEYRRELLRATWIHVQKFPFFGDPLFNESPDFAHLYQGEGIIDFVNYYVQIVLEHGVVGLTLFVLPYALVILGLLGLGGDRTFRNDKTLERQRALMLATVVSYLLLMMTTSAVSYGAHLGVIVLALAASFLAAARHRRGALAAQTTPAAAPVAEPA